MRNLYLIIPIALFVTMYAALTYASGKTANGCSYAVINGKYVTNCGSTAAAPEAAPTTVVASAPVTDYGSVPSPNNPNARQPSVEVAAPRTMNVAIETPNQARMMRPEPTIVHRNSSYSERRQEREDNVLDSAYVGASLGGTTISESGSGSMGVGFSVGTNIDENFGVELGYSYASQDMTLGLNSRSPDLGSYSGMGYQSRTSTDSTLKTHLLTADFIAYLTDTMKRLRPYGLVGLGWKSSKLIDTPDQYYSNNTESELSQSALGLSTGVGTKFRIANQFHLNVAFKYFLPLFRQDAQLDHTTNNSQYNNGYYGNGGYEDGSAATAPRLSTADKKYTGSSQYQIHGGVQYSF